jgi:arginyl-tRNA synthetase
VKHLVRSVVQATFERLKTQKLLQFESLPDFKIEHPKSIEHGDFSTNVCMVLQRAVGKKPDELAHLFVEHVVDVAGVLECVTVAKGYLNFTLKDAAFQSVVREVLSLENDFGRQGPKSSGKKMLVEFVSANPTGPVHLGHARGTFVGDAIARLLAAAGHHVTTEFYINDFGNQVNTLGRTVHKRYRQLFGQEVVLAEGEYPSDYVIEIAKTLRIEVGEGLLSVDEAVWLPVCRAIAIRENLKSIQRSLAQANVSHDVYFSEQSLHETGKVRDIVEVYKSRGVTYEATEGLRKEKGDKVRSDDSKAAKYTDRQLGGTFLKTATYQENGKYVLKDDEDRIILRHDGTPVYLTADLAYHQNKFERGYDLMVDVLGADHGGHVPRLHSGMKLLGFDERKLNVVLVQMVRITRNGEEVKVSKRKGNVYELTDLIDEAGADVCRFIFLMKTANAQFDFDLELVTKQSKENPVFYFQMGHARCAQILKKAGEKNQAFVGLSQLTSEQLQRLTLPEEKAMLKKMSMLPEVVQSAAEKLEPHHVLYFCQELIGDFHSYYTQFKSDPIISADLEKTQGRLAFVAALKTTLKSAFGILGISAPEYMQAPEDEA